MKKLLLTCGLAAILATPAFAAPQERDATRHVQRLQEQLQLDDAQAAKVQSILSEAKTQRQALTDRYKISERDAFRKEMRTLHEATHGEIDAVLTAEQKSTLAELRADRHDKRHEKRQGKMGRDKRGGDCERQSTAA